MFPAWGARVNKEASLTFSLLSLAPLSHVGLHLQSLTGLQVWEILLSLFQHLLSLQQGDHKVAPAFLILRLPSRRLMCVLEVLLKNPRTFSQRAPGHPRDLYYRVYL